MSGCLGRKCLVKSVNFLREEQEVFHCLRRLVTKWAGNTLFDTDAIQLTAQVLFFAERSVIDTPSSSRRWGSLRVVFTYDRTCFFLFCQWARRSAIPLLKKVIKRPCNSINKSKPLTRLFPAGYVSSHLLHCSAVLLWRHRAAIKGGWEPYGHQTGTRNTYLWLYTSQADTSKRNLSTIVSRNKSIYSISQEHNIFWFHKTWIVQARLSICLMTKPFLTTPCFAYYVIVIVILI